jgi:hypothetical protein
MAITRINRRRTKRPEKGRCINKGCSGQVFPGVPLHSDNTGYALGSTRLRGIKRWACCDPHRAVVMAALQAQHGGTAFPLPASPVESGRFWGKAMDVSQWLAWSLVLIPIAGVCTIAVLIRDEWRVRRSLLDDDTSDVRNEI